jgi:hypothetical protein
VSKSKRTNNSFPPVPMKCEGQQFVVTDYGHLLVKPTTAEWFKRHHAKKGLKQATIDRRADASLVATACFLSEQAWRKGKCLEEI